MPRTKHPGSRQRNGPSVVPTLSNGPKTSSTASRSLSAVRRETPNSYETSSSVKPLPVRCSRNANRTTFPARSYRNSSPPFRNKLLQYMVHINIYRNLSYMRFFGILPPMIQIPTAGSYAPDLCVQCGARPRPVRKNWPSVHEALKYNSFPEPPLRHHMCEACYAVKQGRKAWQKIAAQERRTLGQVRWLLNTRKRFRKRRVRTPSACFGCCRDLRANDTCVRITDPSYQLNVILCVSCFESMRSDEGR